MGCSESTVKGQTAHGLTKPCALHTLDEEVGPPAVDLPMTVRVGRQRLRRRHLGRAPSPSPDPAGGRRR